MGEGDGAFGSEDDFFLLAEDFEGLTEEMVLVVGDVEGAGEGALFERLVVGAADEPYDSVRKAFWHGGV